MTILRRDEGPRGAAAHNGIPVRATSGTVIAAGAEMEGTLRTREPVRIAGALRGRLESSAAVVVEQGARLEAQVVAPELVVGGLIDGDVDCHGRCLVRASALVRGVLRAGALRIEEGAWLDGKFQMRPIDDPALPTPTVEVEAGRPARVVAPSDERPRRRAAPDAAAEEAPPPPRPLAVGE